MSDAKESCFSKLPYLQQQAVDAGVGKFIEQHQGTSQLKTYITEAGGEDKVWDFLRESFAADPNKVAELVAELLKNRGWASEVKRGKWEQGRS